MNKLDMCDWAFIGFSLIVLLSWVVAMIVNCHLL